MAGSASKQKGNRGENEICKFMTGVFGGHWMRTPFSGAFVGGSNASRKLLMEDGTVKILKGDIVTPSIMPKLVIESKNYKDFNFSQLLQDKPNINLEDWIKQEEEASDPDDFLIIVFKITRKGSYICLEEKFANQLEYNNHAVYYCHYNNKKYIITEFEPFINKNKEQFLKLAS